MKIPGDIKYTQELLHEAMELLEDNCSRFGMFQRQQYGILKKRFDEHETLGEGLRVALNEIDTEG